MAGRCSSTHQCLASFPFRFHFRTSLPELPGPTAHIKRRKGPLLRQPQTLAHMGSLAAMRRPGACTAGAPGALGTGFPDAALPSPLSPPAVPLAVTSHVACSSWKTARVQLLCASVFRRNTQSRGAQSWHTGCQAQPRPEVRIRAWLCYLARTEETWGHARDLFPETVPRETHYPACGQEPVSPVGCQNQQRPHRLSSRVSGSCCCVLGGAQPPQAAPRAWARLGNGPAPCPGVLGKAS